MPSYQFRCNDCKHEFEVFQRMSDPYPTECPNCKKEHLLEKIFTESQPAAFKGTGWFASGGY